MAEEKKQKIVIVMDGFMLAGYQKQALEEAGYDVEIFIYPETFLMLLKKAPDSFDLLMIESFLPSSPFLNDSENDRPEYIGVALYNRLQAVRPGKPTLFLSEEPLGDRLKSAPHLVIRKKVESRPSDVVRIVKMLLAQK